MIQELFEKVAAQVKPPEFEFTTSVSARRIHFSRIGDVDTSAVDASDPIVQLILDRCIQVCTTNGKCVIDTSTNVESIISQNVGAFMESFLVRHMKQKNVKVTKLYRWFSLFGGSRQVGPGFNSSMVELYRYLYTNTGNHSDNSVEDQAVHIQNGLGLLNTIKSKYESQGIVIGENHGRRRRRNRR